MAAKSVLEIVINGTDNFSKNMSGSLDKLGKKIAGIGTALTVGVTAPIVAFGVKAVSAASDLEESMNKVNVVFGDSAKAVQDFASNAALALGMSNQQALEAAGTFGNLFTSMGIGQEAAADMSTELLTLAADLASFNNIDPTVALEKLRAGLVGEVEPLRTLGVNLSAAAVEARALEMGLIADGEEMDAAAKAQAAYSIILEQTTNAQGDFARTSEGLANQQRILTAQFNDAAASLGTLLIPLALKLVDALTGVMEWVNKLTPTQQKWLVSILAVAAAIGPLLVFIGSLISAIGAIIPVVTAVAGVLSGPLVAVLALVVAAIVFLAAAWKENWFGIRDTAKIVTDYIKGIIENWKGVIENLWKALTAFLRGDWEAFGTYLKTAAVQAFENIKEAATKVWDAIKAIDWGALGKALIQGIANGISSAATLIKDAALRAAQAAWAAIKKFFGIDSPSKVFAGLGVNMMQGMALGITQGQTLPAAAATNAAANVVNTANTYVMNVQTNAQTSTLIRDFSIMRSMA